METDTNMNIHLHTPPPTLSLSLGTHCLFVISQYVNVCSVNICSFIRSHEMPGRGRQSPAGWGVEWPGHHVYFVELERRAENAIETDIVVSKLVCDGNYIVECE